MKKSVIVLIGIVLSLTIILVSILICTNSNQNQKIAKRTEPSLEVIDDYNQNVGEKDVVLTVGSNYEIYKMSEKEILEDKNYYAVIGKITSIDGSTNYNEVAKEYTTVFSLGKMQVLKDLKGNMKDNTINIMKRGGKISLAQYEKSLSESQKQKEEYQKLSQKYSKQKASVQVEYKSLDELDIELDKEYLFILMYNPDYDRYLINAFPYALKEVKTENSKLYFKNHSTQNFEEFYSIDDTLNK